MEGGWTTLEAALEAVRPSHIVISFENAMDDWLYGWGPSDPGEVQRRSITAPDGSQGVEVSVRDMKGWDTYRLTDVGQPFEGDRALTTFWARGWGQTDQMLVEWQEQDGSRWIASVPLADEWRHYALPVEAFAYWNDSPAIGRGGPDDHLRLDQVDALSLGIATGHTPVGLEPGDHRWAVAGFGTAPSPVEEADLTDLELECLTPWYKTHTPEDVQGLRPTVHGILAQLPADLELPGGDILCPITRPRGLGVMAEPAPGRFVPLVEVTGEAGAWRGNAAFVWHQHQGDRAGARWGGVGMEPSTDAGPIINAAARVLLEPAAFTRAGATRWTAFADEPPLEVAAEVWNAGESAGEAIVRLRVIDELGDRIASLSIDAGAIAPGETIALEPESLPELEPGFYTIEASLIVDDRAVDRIDHPVSVHPAEPAEGPRIQLSADETHFQLDGEPFRVHGINYWPLYVAGADSEQYWGHWLSSDQYDPVAVERDLELLERLGANVVSIQYLDGDMAGPLVDFLARCRRHGIYANLFINDAHPFWFTPEHVRGLLTMPRLMGNPAVFAYDLAWEPHVGREERRGQFDPLWRQWVEDNYGSAERLEEVMGGSLPRDDGGEITGPTDAQISDTEPSEADRIFVAAYRHFVDDMVSYGYGRVTGFIRHDLGDPAILGARTGYGGTGQPAIVPSMPFDLLSGAAHLDCTQPEGYGLAGDWINFRHGGLTTQYGRWAGNAKPVWWAEYGRSVYSGDPEPTDELLEIQRELYENTFRMILESRADGSTGWWWPGGYRVDERSDYGIISPQATPRPAALELRRFATDMADVEPLPEPTMWIEFDRDLHSTGYAGVWLEHRDEYAQAMERGEWVALRTEATGTTTETFPRVSIGNVPWEPGLPFKHLKGEIHRPTLLRGGEAPLILDPTVGAIPSGPGELRMEVVNTSEVTWLAGDVAVVLRAGGEPTRMVIDEELARYDRTSVSLSVDLPAGLDGIEVRLELDEQPFGVPLRVVVEP
jgi:hypothetical protein